MKTVFKTGDKVYDIRYGWGIITDVNHTKLYPISVEFDTLKERYTIDGNMCTCKDTKPTLSFTEYTLQGFSQERPEVLPNRGDVVWVRNNQNEDWCCAQFMWKVDGYYRAAICNPWKESNGVHYKLITTINPYSNESNKNV